MMARHKLERHFGITAVEMGYVTANQLQTAMRLQLDEDLNGMDHRLIGQILIEEGFINSGQLGKVLLEMR